jgi:hypothetical protein
MDKTLLPTLISTEEYTLTNAEEKAIKEALEYSNKGETFSHESVMKEAQIRYPQFMFKIDIDDKME